MIRLSALLLLLLVPGFAEAQRRYYQPEYSMPGPAQDDVPEWAIKATCEVHAGGAGGTGGIFHFDKESKKCYVVTCRHVVSNQTIPLYVKLYDGIRREAQSNTDDGATHHLGAAQPRSSGRPARFDAAQQVGR